jgi:hypothetical protein
MDEKTYESVRAVVEYLLHDEKRDWEESGKPKGHIYTHIKRLADWADEAAKDYSNCAHCNDTHEYEGDTCPYCKPNKEQEDGESRMDFNKGN